MASDRGDLLAKQLADQMRQAPVKGRVIGTPAEPAPSTKPSTSTRETARTTRRSTDDSTSTRSPERPARSTREAASPTARPRRPARSPASTRPAAPPERLVRGAPGTVRRGHLVPHDVHGRARRRKTELRGVRGGRVTWDDVMAEGISLLVDRAGPPEEVLEDVRRTFDGDPRRRLVQATLPIELDDRLVALHLDLSDRPVGALTYEQMWSAAVLMWLDATR